MELIAHAGGWVDPWGFAYTGGVIGAGATALWIVHARVTRPRAATLIPSWLVLAGFACGVIVGFGVAGLLDRSLA